MGQKYTNQTMSRSDRCHNFFRLGMFGIDACLSVCLSVTTRPPFSFRKHVGNKRPPSKVSDLPTLPYPKLAFWKLASHRKLASLLVLAELATGNFRRGGWRRYNMTCFDDLTTNILSKYVGGLWTVGLFLGCPVVGRAAVLQLALTVPAVLRPSAL